MRAPASPAARAALALLLVTVVLANVGAGLAWVAQTAAADAGRAAETEGSMLLDLAGVGRWLVYLGVAAMGGAWVVAARLLPAARAHTPTAEDIPWSDLAADAWRVGAVATGFVLLGTVLRAVGQLLAFSDPLEPWTTERFVTILTATTWGRTWLALFAAALLGVTTGAIARLEHGRGRAALLAATIAVAVADGMAGHGLAGDWGGVPGVALHAVHLLGASAWLGALAVAMLVMLVAPSADDAVRRRRAMRPVLECFAPVALAGGALVIGAGLLMGWRYVGPLDALLESEYGRMLTAKSLLAVAVLALGAWHWRVAVPRWRAAESADQPAAAAERHVRRSVLAELVLFAIILLLSAILVALGAPGV